MPSMSIPIRCPFYRETELQRTIGCEGVIPGTGLTQNFQTMEECKQYCRDYCCGSYQECEICRLILGKYQQDNTVPVLRTTHENPCVSCSKGYSWATCPQKSCKKAEEYWVEVWEETRKIWEEIK